MCKEVISLHIGQTGIQSGCAMWELYLLEHDIDIDGCSNTETGDISYSDKNQSRLTFFHEANNNHYFPRAVFIDSESDVMDELKTGVLRNLFSSDCLINSHNDGSNNFARGGYSLGRDQLKNSLDVIRKYVEASDEIQGFILNHSLSGGTGSGLSTVFLHALTKEYSKKLKYQFQIYPGSRLSSNVVEPYNSTLHIHSTIDTSDLGFIIDNQTLYKMCKEFLLIYSPYFIDINRLLAVMKSSVTSTMRFGNFSNSDMADTVTNIVPFPRIHFPVISHSPIKRMENRSYESLQIHQLIKMIFDRKSFTIDYDINRDKYISIMLIARGEICNFEVSQMMYNMKEKHKLEFVEWSPNGIKMSLNRQVPQVIPESCMASFNKSLTMISNNTTMKYLWNDLGRKFDHLFNKRAYIHWFIEEGMEESEFFEARIDMAMLSEDYDEISMTEDELKSGIFSHDSLASQTIQNRRESVKYTLKSVNSFEVGFPSTKKGTHNSI